MAMTLPIAIPSTPTSDASPAPPDAAEQPRSPRSPSSLTSVDPLHQSTLALPQSPQLQEPLPSAHHPPQQTPNANPAQMKRKPSRRANTAERRATHNAVERQRRETLNGRFLDLAALLPNLSQIRRPSKSSIVNSSIAHIQASRRHRIVAARELRLVKLEADALRRELNEWRDRAGIPRIEEPIRSEAFSMVLSGEVEIINTVAGEEEEDDINGQYDDDEYMGAPPQEMLSSPMIDEIDDHHRMAMIKNATANANPFAHSLPAPVVSTSGPGPQGNGIHLSHIITRPQSGMMPSSAYDTPAAAAAMAGLYDHPGQYPSQFMHPQGGHPGVDPEKLAAWNLYSQQQQQQQQMLQAQRSLFTPPTTSHGLPTPTSASSGNGSNGSGSPPGSSGSPGTRAANGNPFSDPSFFVNLQRQQLMHGSNNSHGYTSAERDEPVPRVANGPRERSGSVMSVGSGSGYGGSPPHHGGHGGASPVGNYELAPGARSGAPVTGAGEPYVSSRRPGWGRDVIDLGVHAHHGHHPGAAAAPGHHGHHHHPIGAGMLPSPISAGGNGGGGGGFAMMM